MVEFVSPPVMVDARIAHMAVVEIGVRAVRIEPGDRTLDRLEAVFDARVVEQQSLVIASIELASATPLGPSAFSRVTREACHDCARCDSPFETKFPN
jgi:hypothetical protein